MPKWHKSQMLYCPLLTAAVFKPFKPSVTILCTPSHNSSTHLSSHFSSSGSEVVTITVATPRMVINLKCLMMTKFVRNIGSVNVPTGVPIGSCHSHARLLPGQAKEPHQQLRTTPCLSWAASALVKASPHFSVLSTATSQMGQ